MHQAPLRLCGGQNTPGFDPLTTASLLKWTYRTSSTASCSLLSERTWIYDLGPARPQVDPQCKSREVAVFCPFWLLNKTDVPLHCRDSTLRSQTPQLAAPALGGPATPLLFSSARNGLHLRVGGGGGPWSPSISLDKIGALAARLPAAESRSPASTVAVAAAGAPPTGAPVPALSLWAVYGPWPQRGVGRALQGC